MVRPALSFSEAGGHCSNEDAFAIKQHPLDSHLWLCFVADGQGGRAGGAKRLGSPVKPRSQSPPSARPNG